MSPSLPLLLAGLFVATAAAGAQTPATAPAGPIVEVEEEAYRYEDPANGSGPFWCAGNTCIVRAGDRVVVSGSEKIADARPLNNVRWTLLARAADGWRVQRKDPAGRTREPSPICVFPDDGGGAGTLFLSANPTLAGDAYSGPARPEVLRFPVDDLAGGPVETILPAWEGKPAFSEHSYRSFAADGERRELILLQNVGYAHAEWSFRDAAGRWSARGRLTWPWGADYERPQPIRICYPAVQLRGRAVHLLGVSDIIEPKAAWREYKRQITKQEWDYDFRRLFYTSSPDIAAGRFGPWVEVASREETAGWIFPCDLYADEGGTVHLLWTERALDVRLREKFFPGRKQSEALNYATIRDGAVTSRRAVVRWEEGDDAAATAALPGRGRFHVAADGRLFIFFHVMAPAGDGPRAGRKGENRLVEVRPDGTFGPAMRVPLARPVGTFFTAGVRAGCKPSDVIDVLGDGGGGAVRYARVRVPPAGGARPATR